MTGTHSSITDDNKDAKLMSFGIQSNSDEQRIEQQLNLPINSHMDSTDVT